ncbi:MAG: Abi family protein [Chitinophagaceae bacterium]
MKYTATSKTLDQLVDKLLSQGLRIEDIDTAKDTILKTGFFRFNRYMHSFQESDGKGAYNFVDGTVLDNVIEVYQFDTSLRMAIFEAIANIEVSFKAILNYYMYITFGPHWYISDRIYKPAFTQVIDDNSNSGYDKFLIKLTSECVNSKEQYIKKYRQDFEDPELPPCWMIMEIIPFGTVCSLYQNISDTPIRQAIAEKFNTLHNILETWLISLSYLRNQCAHHHKIIDRAFMFPPIIPKRKTHKFLNDCDIIEESSLYAILCIIQHMLRSLGLNPTFKDRLKHLALNSKSFDIKNLGFTDDWQKEPIWN